MSSLDCLAKICYNIIESLYSFNVIMTNNIVLYSGKILAEISRDFLFFPFWWYSLGLMMIINKMWEFLKNREKSLVFLVWLKNFWRPMYGQTDWQGILISLAMRFVQIIFRGIILLFWALICLLVILFWLIFPPFVIYQIFYQLIA